MTFARILAVIVFVFSVFTVESPGADTGVIERSQYHMGTTAGILIGNGSNKDVDAAFAEMEALDDMLSDFKADSELSRINAMAGIAPVRVSGPLIDVLNDAITVARQTGGAFDPTIGALTIGVYRFGRQSRDTLDAETVDKARRLVDYKKIVIRGDEVFLAKKGMMLDLGGIGKGYAVQRASEVLKARGVKSGIVSLSGDIKVFGRDIEIGIRDPSGRGLAASFRTGTDDLAISTSGGYERTVDIDGESYHHLLVPGTGEPGGDFLSVTVVLPGDNTLADAYATALFVMGKKRAHEFLAMKDGIGVFFIYADGETYHNAAFSRLVNDLEVM